MSYATCPACQSEVEVVITLRYESPHGFVKSRHCSRCNGPVGMSLPPPKPSCSVAAGDWDPRWHDLIACGRLIVARHDDDHLEPIELP